MNRGVKEIGLSVLRGTGYLDWRLGQSAGRARVLTYHGVCRHEERGEWWVPSSFVSVEQFRRQMAYVGANMNCVTLEQLRRSLQSGGFIPPRTVAITFDDGYANNVTLAAPVLAAHGLKATFFLTTGLADGHELLWVDKLRLIRQRLDPHSIEGDDLLAKRIDAKTCDIESLLMRIGRWWDEIRGRIEPAVFEGLRMMTWSEARDLQEAGHSIGAHTRRHAILAAQPEAVRRAEILDSVEDVRRQCGVTSPAFAYPNGQPGDFDGRDIVRLTEAGVTCAVTTLAGPNRVGQDVMTLRRNPVGLYHSQAGFLAELAGLRDQE